MNLDIIAALLKKCNKRYPKKDYIDMMPALAHARMYARQLDILYTRIKSNLSRFDKTFDGKKVIKILHIVELDYQTWLNVSCRLLKSLLEIDAFKTLSNKKEYKKIMVLRNNLLEHPWCKGGIQTPSFTIEGGVPRLKTMFNQTVNDEGYFVNKDLVDCLLKSCLAMVV